LLIALSKAALSVASWEVSLELYLAVRRLREVMRPPFVLAEGSVQMELPLHVKRRKWRRSQRLATLQGRQLSLLKMRELSGTHNQLRRGVLARELSLRE
jgi:hypothetical protein